MKFERMDEHSIHIPTMFPSALFTISCFYLISLPQSYCDFNYSVCKQPYECGELRNIYYPFWGNKRDPICGGGDPFKLTCHDNDNTTIQIGSQNLNVKQIDMEDMSMRLARAEVAVDVCSLHSEDFNVNLTPIIYNIPPFYNMTIFYNCSKFNLGYKYEYIHEYNFTCGDGFSYYVFDYRNEQMINKLSSYCNRSLHLRSYAPQEYYDGDGKGALEKVIGDGFWVGYNVSEDCARCLSIEAGCWMDGIEKHIESCYYNADGSQSQHCSKNGNNLTKRIIFLGVPSVVIGGLIIFITLRFRVMIKRNQHIESFLKNHGALNVKRYKFSEVKKMTNSFNIKLGQGGFGSVYKGKLLTGSPVAVKLLNSSKRNGEDFINEVSSISRTSHVNIVTLLGFCLEGRKKSLIYEFMSNGSLDKFIHNKGLKTTQSLSWDNLWQISIGVARGLEYLHRGCNTRILHFDIKPHNILLDETFCPKISDFGLAKLCPRKESIITMSDARGTMGYVAPEVWNRQFGGVSHKSDVYSYGMMLLEMVGGRKNLNAEASNTSEIYFPHWVYNRLEQGEDLRPHDGVIASEENEIARRMTVVGLWCVQTFPNDRPTMSRVIDMLEGNINSLDIPPKPVVSSPTRSVPEVTTSSMHSG